LHWHHNGTRERERETERETEREMEGVKLQVSK
jgi:hypothetical protein